MPWISPTEFIDPQDEWEDEANAFDGDTDTFALWPNIPDRAVTGPLHLTFPQVTTDSIRVYQSHSGAVTRIWLYIVPGGLPYGENAQSIPEDPGWVTWEFSLQPVASVQINFTGPKYEAKEARIHECAIWVPCRGPLVSICDFLFGVGEFFVDLAADIREVWVVGEYLATPFENLADLFYDASDLCCVASGVLQDVLDALEGGITPAAILSLIQDNWPTLYELITDPVDWFLVQLNLAFNLEPWHTQSLEFLAKWVLEEYFPILYQLWLDPETWFSDHIFPLLPELPDWLTDPVGWLEATLQEHFPILYYLVVDPTGEILYLIGLVFDLTPYEARTGEFVIKALFERYFPELYLLWREPEQTLWTWLLDKFEDVFDGIQERLYYLAEHALRFFWEGEW